MIFSFLSQVLYYADENSLYGFGFKVEEVTKKISTVLILMQLSNGFLKRAWPLMQGNIILSVSDGMQQMKLLFSKI